MACVFFQWNKYNFGVYLFTTKIPRKTLFEIGGEHGGRPLPSYLPTTDI